MNTTQTQAPRWIPGDIIEDPYANPAVVLRVADDGLPTLAMQTVGSDRGRTITFPRFKSTRFVRITDEARSEWARDVARTEWRNGNRW